MTATVPGPVTARERVRVLDFLRGVAVLGILLVNVRYFASPEMYLLILGEEWFTGPRDQLATFLVSFLVEGKFYPVFSFLFGLGFALQMERAEPGDANAMSTYRRRLLVLLAIGALHAVLFSYVDILVMYALLGFVLTAFRDPPDAAVLACGAALVALPVVLVALVVVLPGAAGAGGGGLMPSEAWLEARIDASAALYGNGSFVDATSARLVDLVVYYSGALGGAPIVLGMFLIGLWAGRRRLLHDVHAHRGLLARVLAIGLPVGLAAAYVSALVESDVNPVAGTGPVLVEAATRGIGGPVLGMAYVAGLALLHARGAFGALAAPIEAAGRMALTNYLAQSVIMGAVFHGWGLGLYGQVGPAWWLAFGLGVYAVQVLVSWWWLRRHRFGPVEWVWRRLTYARPLRMRRAAAT